MVTIAIAKPVEKKLKILLYGASGSGKTLATLSFPRILLVDSEAGSELYRGRPGVPAFHVAECKTLTDLDDVIRQFEADKGKTWDTLVIDPISVFYAVEKNVTSANNSRDIDMRGWNKINGRMNGIYTKLTSLKGHVVVIARESIEYSGEGLNLKKVGVKPDADKNLIYMMDFVIHMNANHSGMVEKSRGVLLGKEGLLPIVNWDVFAPVAAPFATGEQSKHESEEEATLREMDSMSNKETAAAFYEWCIKEKGLTQSDIFIALKIEQGLGEYQDGRKAAEKAIEQYITDHITATVATPKANGVANTTSKAASAQPPASGVVTDVEGFADAMQQLHEKAKSGEHLSGSEIGQTLSESSNTLPTEVTWPELHAALKEANFNPYNPKQMKTVFGKSSIEGGNPEELLKQLNDFTSKNTSHRWMNEVEATNHWQGWLNGWKMSLSDFKAMMGFDTTNPDEWNIRYPDNKAAEKDVLAKYEAVKAEAEKVF